MRLLLDTHALVWWLTGDKRLSRRARTAIGGNDNDVFVSAASAWEIAMKSRMQRWPEAEKVTSAMSAALVRQGFIALPIDFDHAERAGRLPGSHSDPFDRILAAQALCDGLAMVTADRRLEEFGVSVLW